MARREFGAGYLAVYLGTERTDRISGAEWGFIKWGLFLNGFVR
jgi:hypothetical protein